MDRLWKPVILTTVDYGSPTRKRGTQVDWWPSLAYASGYQKICLTLIKSQTSRVGCAHQFPVRSFFQSEKPGVVGAAHPTEMHSTSSMLLWEAWRRGALWCAVTLVTVASLAVIIYGGLSRSGPLEPAAGRTLHLVFLWIQFVCFGGAAYAAQGSPARLYLWPVSVRRIAGWSLCTGIALLSAMYLFTAVFVNRQYGVDWPLVGPALFFGAAFAVLQAVLWFTKGRGVLQIAGCGLTALFLERWLHARYGGGPPLSASRMWYHVTLVEFASLSAMIAAAYAVAVFAIARDRRGDCERSSTQRSTWLTLAVARLLRTRRTAFRSPAAAQFWMEWRQKGLIIPGLLAAFLVFLMLSEVFHLFPRREYETLHLLLGFGMGLVPIAAVAGLVLGHGNSAPGQLECGSFLATRPLTSAGLAAAPLKAAAVSLGLTCGVWGASLAIATLRLNAAEGLDAVLDLWTMHGELADYVRVFGVGWGGLVVGFCWLATWTLLSLGLTIALTGRQPLVIGVFVAGLAMLIVVAILDHAIPDEYHAVARRAAAIGLGSVGLLGAGAVCWSARRRRVLTRRQIALGACAWWALCTFVFLVRGVVSPTTPLSVWLVGGLLALSLVSLAGAPLAVYWNRHR